MHGRRAMEGVNSRGGEREGVVGDIKPVCTEDCVRITEIKCQPKERREGRVEWSRASGSPSIATLLASRSPFQEQRSGVKETREHAIHRGPGLTLRAWQT